MQLLEFLEGRSLATPREVADMLKCSRGIICKWVATGELQAFRRERRGPLGRNPDRPGSGRRFIRIAPRHLQAWLDTHETSIHPNEKIIPRDRAGNPVSLAPSLRFATAVNQSGAIDWPPKAPQRRKKQNR